MAFGVFKGGLRGTWSHIIWDMYHTSEIKVHDY